MDEAIRRLRTAGRQFSQGKAPTGIRYPGGFRDRVVAVARQRVTAGGSVGRIAQELGVARPTLVRWLGRPTTPRLRPVSVAPDPVLEAISRPLLITREGIRVEGLDAATLIVVLRALAS